MVSSKATTVNAYIKELPKERQEQITIIRNLILKSLPKGYKEQMQYGMIGYVVPFSLYPEGYHCLNKNKEKEPLPYAGLAAQKNHLSFYCMNTYGDKKMEKWITDEFKKAGKKLSMGKCCIRFKTADDIPHSVVTGIIKHTSVKQYVKYYEDAISNRTKKK